MADIDVIECERGIHVKLPLTWVPVFFVYSLFCPEKFLETMSMDNHTKTQTKRFSQSLFGTSGGPCSKLSIIPF